MRERMKKGKKGGRKQTSKGVREGEKEGRKKTSKDGHE